MNTTFVINGGAGRVLSAIPALENYHDHNPHDQFKVLIPAWHFLYEFHPLLKNRTFPLDPPGTFSEHVYESRLVVPEPFHLREYYHDKVSMARAFDLIINGADAKDQHNLKVYVDPFKDTKAVETLHEIKMKTGKEHVIVFQPFGSGARIEQNKLVDPSTRSIDINVYNQIVDGLSDKASVVYFGPIDYWPYTNRKSHHLLSLEPTLMDYMCMIANCDYFIGCDSVGQHAARGLDKKGMVLMGATFESNTSYPDYEKFKFIRKAGLEPIYSPVRISAADMDQANELNHRQRMMDFNQSEINQIVSTVLASLDD